MDFFPHYLALTTLGAGQVTSAVIRRTGCHCANEVSFTPFTDTHGHTGTWLDSGLHSNIKNKPAHGQNLISGEWVGKRRFVWCYRVPLGSFLFVDYTLRRCLYVIQPFHRSKNYPWKIRLRVENAFWKQFECHTLTNTITHTLITHTYTCTHTKTYKPDFSKQSCGPSLTPKSALSRLVAIGSLSSVSLSLPVSEPPLIQCAAHILSQHAVTAAKALEQAPRGY